MVNQVKERVITGDLVAGFSLPSIRQLANELGVNQNTVAKAYKELEIQDIQSTITIIYGEEKIDINGGMVICRDRAGEFHVLIHAMQNRKKILEAAYRYCTRWVRLDI